MIEVIPMKETATLPNFVKTKYIRKKTLFDIGTLHYM